MQRISPEPCLFCTLKTYHMSLTLRTTLGCTEAVIDDDGGLNRFYQIASVLSDGLDIAIINKEDDFDTIDWNFKFQGHLITLHYNIYTGISLFPTLTKNAVKKANNAVVDVANALHNLLMNTDRQRIA